MARRVGVSKRRQRILIWVAAVILLLLITYPCLDIALIRVARDGDFHSVNRLLFLRVDPNTRLVEPGYALIQAADFGHVDIVKALLAAGADPNSHVEGGETALIYAVSNHHNAVVQALLAAGANPNLSDGGGNSPLKYAQPYPDTINLLRKAGAEAQGNG